jgi:hypothetical protein
LQGKKIALKFGVQIVFKKLKRNYLRVPDNCPRTLVDGGVEEVFWGYSEEEMR